MKALTLRPDATVSQLDIRSMLYRKYQPGTIKVEPSSVHSQSSAVVERLQRIEQHYRQLDELLATIEAKLPHPAPAESPVPAEPQLPDSAPETAHSRRLRRRKPR